MEAMGLGQGQEARRLMVAVGFKKTLQIIFWSLITEESRVSLNTF